MQKASSCGKVVVLQGLKPPRPAMHQNRMAAKGRGMGGVLQLQVVRRSSVNATPASHQGAGWGKHANGVV